MAHSVSRRKLASNYKLKLVSFHRCVFVLAAQTPFCQDRLKLWQVIESASSETEVFSSLAELPAGSNSITEVLAAHVSCHYQPETQLMSAAKCRSVSCRCRDLSSALLPWYCPNHLSPSVVRCLSL